MAADATTPSPRRRVPRPTPHPRPQPAPGKETLSPGCSISSICSCLRRSMPPAAVEAREQVVQPSDPAVMTPARGHDTRRQSGRQRVSG